jgi:hypothetical protein
MQTIFDEPRNAGEMRKQNPENFNPTFTTRMRPPVGMIYIYSVARRDMRATHALFPSLTLRGCKNGERYVLCYQIADPVTQASPDLERGGNRVDEHDGWRVSIDLLNPDNPTTNPWANTANSGLSWGCNLVSRGLFPSRTNPPSEEDLQKAEDARDGHYDRITNEATRLESVSTRELNDYIKQNPDVHDAMDALNLTASWHRKREVMGICPNCGDSIKRGVAFHKSSADVLCIIDAERAYKAGAITRGRMLELTGQKETATRKSAFADAVAETSEAS